jgi:hypothetical protein
MKSSGLLLAEECRASLDPSGKEILDESPLTRAYEHESASAVSRHEWGATTAIKPLCNLALDSIACIEAITASWIAGVPYTGLRDAMRFSDAQKAEIAEAVQKVAVNHAGIFAAQKDAIELGVALTAMQAAQLDQVLLLAADNEPLSWQQVLGGLAIIFAPLLLLLALGWLKRL